MEWAGDQPAQARPPPPKRSRELEREEGVAPARLPDPDQTRPGERRTETGAHQLVERADAQARRLRALQSVRGHGAAQPVRYVAANGEQSGDTLGVEACEREADGRQRCRIQPLQVVDRETERAILDERADRREKGGGNRAVVRVGLRGPRSRAASRA